MISKVRHAYSGRAMASRVTVCIVNFMTPPCEVETETFKISIIVTEKLGGGGGRDWREKEARGRVSWDLGEGTLYIPDRRGEQIEQTT